jgi:hypothetical protein
MKIFYGLLAFSSFLFSCSNPGKSPGNTPEKDSTEKQSFFPVTDFIKGEIYNIKKSGINPLQYTMVNNRTDSAWLPIEQLDTVLQEFLHPEIDSANLISLFTEKSFFDQSIDAITFTYDPIAVLPDSMKLTHWDVYIDPKSNKVRRIYMVKEIDKNKILQLTWVSNKWCKIISIVTNDKGISTIEKEEKFILDF